MKGFLIGFILLLTVTAFGQNGEEITATGLHVFIEQSLHAGGDADTYQGTGLTAVVD